MLSLDSVGALHDFISYFVVFAPDNFPIEDFLEDHEQMTLEHAYKLLRDGVEIAYPDDELAEKKQFLYSLLNKSQAAYANDDEWQAIQSIHEFKNNIFKSE